MIIIARVCERKCSRSKEIKKNKISINVQSNGAAQATCAIRYFQRAYQVLRWQLFAHIALLRLKASRIWLMPVDGNRTFHRRREMHPSLLLGHIKAVESFRMIISLASRLHSNCFCKSAKHHSSSSPWLSCYSQTFLFFSRNIIFISKITKAIIFSFHSVYSKKIPDDWLEPKRRLRTEMNWMKRRIRIRRRKREKKRSK